MMRNSVEPIGNLIKYLTHLEGMAAYAPLEIRQKENAMDVDRDTIDLQNSELMAELEREFFEIYFHFKNNPDEILTDEDWAKFGVVSQLWYRVGAYMAKTIDIKLGREKLVNLISEPSVGFINVYRRINESNE